MSNDLLKVNIIQLDGTTLSNNFSYTSTIKNIKKWVITQIGISNIEFIGYNSEYLKDDITINQLINDSNIYLDLYSININIQNYWLINKYSEYWDNQDEMWVDESSNTFWRL